MNELFIRQVHAFVIICDRQRRLLQQDGFLSDFFLRHSGEFSARRCRRTTVEIAALFAQPNKYRIGNLHRRDRERLVDHVLGGFARALSSA